MPVLSSTDDGMVPMTTDEKELLALHISNITRQEANKIAEMLGNGLVVWDSGKCYPARKIKLELKRRIEQPSKREKELIEAAQEFVAKVECGDARSKRSYARFKVALAAYEGEKE